VRPDCATVSYSPVRDDATVRPGCATVSYSPVRDDATVRPDCATVSVLQNSETLFFVFLCTFKYANGFQMPNLIQSIYN